MYLAMLIMLVFGAGLGYAIGHYDGQKKNRRYDD